MHFKLKKLDNFKLIYLIALFILIVSLIITTFFDYEISEFFAKGMDNYFLRQMVNFVSAGGNFVIVIPFFIVGAVFFETIFFKIKLKNNTVKLLPYILLILGVIFFGALYCIRKASFNFIDDINDFTLNAIWMKTLTTWKEPIIICSIWIILMTIGLSIGTYYFRVKFAKRDDILINKYWVGAIKMLMLVILTYLVVIILKMSFGRPFYFSVIYKDLFGITGDNKNSLFDNLTIYNYQNYPGAKLLIEQFMKAKPNEKLTSIYLDETIKPWMTEVILKSKYGPAPAEKNDWSFWFVPNIFFGNLKNWLSFFGDDQSHKVSEDGTITWNSQWWNNDFPSGHIAAVIITFGTFFIIKQKGPVNFKNKKLQLFILIWGFYTALTFFFMIVYRFHWITDMLFTPIHFMLLIPFVENVVEKLIYKISLKFLKLKQIKVLNENSIIIYKVLIGGNYEIFKVIKNHTKAEKYETKLINKYPNLKIENRSHYSEDRSY